MYSTAISTVQPDENPGRQPNFDSFLHLAEPMQSLPSLLRFLKINLL